MYASYPAEWHPLAVTSVMDVDGEVGAECAACEENVEGVVGVVGLVYVDGVVGVEGVEEEVEGVCKVSFSVSSPSVLFFLLVP
jgi:hypothetical protein